MENKNEQMEELKDKTEKVEEIKKEEKREKENSNDDKKNSKKESEKIGFKSFFGLLVILLGLFYLGRNMGWWDIQFNQAVFWPLVLVFVGLLIIGNRLILRCLLAMLSIFVIVIMASSLLFYFRDSKKIEKISENQAKKNIYQTSVYQSSRGDYNTHFFGNLDRSEVEQKISSILDYIYKSNPNDRKYIEVKIDKK